MPEFPGRLEYVGVDLKEDPDMLQERGCIRF
jgi:hypothetical protein